jgi:excisionase family DNA binding protein
MNKLLMTVHEVAEYLRIKERKVYDLVAQGRIPCTKAAGKWLFPKELIDYWLRQNAECVTATLPSPEPPLILSGSHDPLLDWAVRESGSGLAILFNGSLDGLERFAVRQAVACGLHLRDVETGDYNTRLLEQRFAAEPVVAIEWAWRDQGLMVAPGNPLKIQSFQDVQDKRFAVRQKEAGSHVLLKYLLGQSGLMMADIRVMEPPLRNETEVALAVANGEVDAGLGIAAAAHQLHLAFIPLAKERYDLLVWRRQYFESPFQKLLAFTATQAFSKRLQTVRGYDVSGLGTVRYNAPI